MEYVQDPQLHIRPGSGFDNFRGVMSGNLELILPVVDLLAFPKRETGLGQGCGVLSLFSCGEKSWSGVSGDVSLLSSLFSVVSKEMDGGVSPSSVLFLFFSLLAVGEKKERMSCCLSF